MGSIPSTGGDNSEELIYAEQQGQGAIPRAIEQIFSDLHSHQSNSSDHAYGSLIFHIPFYYYYQLLIFYAGAARMFVKCSSIHARDLQRRMPRLAAPGDSVAGHRTSRRQGMSPIRRFLHGSWLGFSFYALT